MDAATESRQTFRLMAASAGLQAGMLGVCWMLLWLGVSDVWQRRSFWTAENLMASAFYGEDAIHSGFAGRTLSGLALYLLLYSALGALLAIVVNDRLRRLYAFLVCVIFGMCWYYLSFGLLWKSLLPLVALLHSVQSTWFGHIIYGAVLGRYPSYLPSAAAPAEDGAQEPSAEARPSDPLPLALETVEPGEPAPAKLNTVHLSQIIRTAIFR